MQKSFKETKPTLFVVSTPIGNLKDITLRAIETLKEVSFIYAEDTRKASILLKHYDIKTKVSSYHDFSTDLKEQEIIDHLKNGLSVALISDAGTPLISDPGYELTKRVINEGFYVVSIPGASAILASLVVSGLIAQPFIFLGFLPRKNNEMTNLLKEYQNYQETMIIYESPLRIKNTVNTLYSVFGNRDVSISRELTKIFETIIRTTLFDATSMEFDKRGEYVIVVSGNKEYNTNYNLTIVEHVDELIKTGLTEKEAIKEVSILRNLRKNEVYNEYKIKNKKE